MTRPTPRFRKRNALEHDGRSRDAGDTLIELLIAITVIGLTVAGLVGGLAAAISTSGTHRGIADLDGIVRSFAEEARQVIELSPTDAQFKPCVPAVPTMYQLVSAPYPATGPANTAVTVFGSGFTLGGSISKVLLETVPGNPTGATQVYPAAAPPPPFAPAPAPTIPANMFGLPNTYGNTTITFIVPSGLSAQPYYIAVTDSSGVQAVSSVPFNPNPTPTAVDPSPLQNYQIGVFHVQYWNGTGFSASCSPTNSLSADLQQITIQATAPGAGDTYDLAVTSPSVFKAGSSIPITYAGPASPKVGDTLSYTAAVNGLTAPYGSYIGPTGQLSWVVVAPSGPTPTCTQSLWTLPGPTPTCTFKAKTAGAYSVFARFTGDNNFVGSLGECPNPPTLPTCAGSPPGSVAKGTPTVSVVGASNGAAFHPTLTFTATVAGGGVTPSGLVNWSISQTGNPFAVAPTCPQSSLNGSGQTTCTVNNASPGNYTATASYLGDNNYNAATSLASNNVNVPFLIPAVSLSESVSGTTITVTANVSGPAGDPTPTGSVTWSNGLCNTKTTTLDASGNATCTIKNATSSGYFGTFTYNGDINYGSSTSTPVNIPATSGSATGAGTTTLTFKLKVTGPLTGPAPTGSVAWSVKAGNTSVPCLTTSSTSSGNQTTFSCSLTGVPGISYTAQATYPGDSNYLPPFPNPTVIGPVNG